MLTAFVFDGERSEQVEDWAVALEDIDEEHLLWLALRDPEEDEVEALRETLDFGEDNARRLLEPPGRASVAYEGEHMHVTLYAASGEDDGPALCPVECVLGTNWIATAHRGRLAVLEEFLERAEGGGQIGGLDSPLFVAAVLEWVVASYLRAFEEIENELEELDSRVMSETLTRDVSGDLARLVELRRTIGTLRRALAPHREVVVSLEHPELDALSSEKSAQRYGDLERRVTQALDAARETKESTFGSFELLSARIGQRTNDIMKVLTLVTVILLPATVLGGIMGMNFQVSVFGHAWLFWGVIATMLAIAAVVLSVARTRQWI